MENNKLSFIDLQMFGEDDDNLDINDFIDDEEEDTETEKQSRKQNAIQARKRREKEQQEILEKAKKEAYEKGLLEGKKSLSKINTFTDEAIEDDEDLADYELMIRLEKEGKNPLKDFIVEKRKLVREKRAEEAKKKEEKDKQQAKEEKDTQDFIKAIGDKEKAYAIVKDKKFMIFSKGRLGKEPLTEIYKDFVEFTQGEKIIPQLPNSQNGEGDNNSKKKFKSVYESDKFLKSMKFGG